MKKPIYRLYDVYEDREKLGEFETLSEVKKECKQRDIDIDSEWTPLLYKYDEKTEKYKMFTEWSY